MCLNKEETGQVYPDGTADPESGPRNNKCSQSNTRFYFQEPFGFMDVKKINKGEEKTRSVVFTSTHSPPTEITVPFYRPMPIRRYVPEPAQCFKCHRWYRTIKVCRSCPRCYHCGKQVRPSPFSNCVPLAITLVLPENLIHIFQFSLPSNPRLLRSCCFNLLSVPRV